MSLTDEILADIRGAVASSVAGGGTPRIDGVDPSGLPDESDQRVKESGENRPFLRILSYPLVAIMATIFSLFAFAVWENFGSSQKVDKESLSLHGARAVNETDLRHLIVSNGLTVYWVGPKVGAKYILDASDAKAISLRSVSVTTDSNGTNETYYEVGTYVSKDAFVLTEKAALQPNGVGFTNIDGNAIFYNAENPNNVYIGLKNVPFQVQIYSPAPTQALAYALLQGKVQKIK